MIVAMFYAKVAAVVALVVIEASVMIPPTISYNDAGTNYSSEESINKNPFSRSESRSTKISIRKVEVSSAYSGLIIS